jgi:hypothetical protein
VWLSYLRRLQLVAVQLERQDGYRHPVLFFFSVVATGPMIIFGLLSFMSWDT